MNRRTITLAPLAIAVAVALTACGKKEEPAKAEAPKAAAAAPAKPQLKIGHVAPLTGGIAHLGTDAAEAVVDRVRDPVERVLADGVQAVADPGIGMELRIGKHADGGPQQLGPGKRVALAAEQQNRAGNPRPVRGALRRRLRMARPMEWVADQDQAGRSVIGGEEAGDPAPERVATNHRVRARRRLLAIDRERPLGGSSGQLNRLGREPAAHEALGPRAHRFRGSRCPMGQANGEPAVHGS